MTANNGLFRSLSLPSRQGAFVLDVPDIYELSVSFEYNFYDKQERTIKSDIGIEIGNTNLADYRSYVAISFNVGSSDSVTAYDFGLKDKEINDMIFTEKDFGGNIFTGISTNIPNEIETLQKLIKETTTILSNEAQKYDYTNVSTTDFIKTYADAANTKNFLFSAESKKNLVRLFENASNEGLGLNQSSNPNLDFVGYDFNGSYFSPVLKDIERSARERSTSLMSNAFKEQSDKFTSISNEAIANVSPNRTKMSNYYPSIDSKKLIKDVSLLNSIFDNSSDFNIAESILSAVKLVGFRVKTSIFMDNGDYVDLEPTYVNSPSIRELYLTNVPYNSQCSIRVEPVYLMLLPAIDKILGINVMTKVGIFVAGSAKSQTVLAIDSTKPNPPQDLLFDLDKHGLSISWSLPFDTQRIIDRFRVYRRKATSEPFTLIHQISFSATKDTLIPDFINEKVPNLKTFFIDESFDMDSNFIYAVSAVNAHDLSSDYSEQISVRVNPVTNKLDLKLVSRIGSFLSYPNMNIEEELFEDVVKTSGYSRLTAYFNPDFMRVYRSVTGGAQEDLVNLDESGENTPTKAFKINLINIDLQEQQTIDIIIGKGPDTDDYDSGDSAIVRTFSNE